MPETTASLQPRPDSWRSRLLTAVLFTIVCLTWGTTWLGIRVAVQTVPPLTAAGARFLITFPLFLILARIKREPLLFPRGRRGYFAFVVLGYFTIPYFLINYGEQHVSSGLTALLFSTMPVFTMLFSTILLRERITLWQLIGIAVGFMSLLLILVSEEVGMGYRELAGVAAILGAAVLHAISYVMAKRNGAAIGVITFNTLPVGVAGAGLFLAGWLVERPVVALVSRDSILALAYLGVVASVGGFITYFHLLKRSSPVFLSFIFIIFPVVSLLVGSWYEAKPISVRFALLFALLLGGFVLTKVPGGPRRLGWLSGRPAAPTT
jgi:putative membrane protein PagO